MLSPVLECLAGGALVLVGMLAALGLVRLAANVYMAMCWGSSSAVFAILNGYWVGGAGSRSLGLGWWAALLCYGVAFQRFHEAQGDGGDEGRDGPIPESCPWHLNPSVTVSVTTILPQRAGG